MPVLNSAGAMQEIPGIGSRGVFVFRVPDAQCLTPILLLTSRTLSDIKDVLCEGITENDDDRCEKRTAEPVRAIVPRSAPASAHNPIARRF